MMIIVCVILEIVSVSGRQQNTKYRAQWTGRLMINVQVVMIEPSYSIVSINEDCHCVGIEIFVDGKSVYHSFRDKQDEPLKKEGTF